jgi:hypothetical protein
MARGRHIRSHEHASHASSGARDDPGCVGAVWRPQSALEPATGAGCSGGKVNVGGGWEGSGSPQVETQGTQGKMASKLYASSIKIFDPKRNSGPATLCTLCRAHPTPPPVKPPQPAATCDLRIVLIAHVNIGWVHRLCRLNLGSSNERIVV